MCNPVAVGLAVYGVASAAKSYASYKGQKAQNDASEYNAELLDRNAQLAEQQAGVSIQRGKLEADKYRMQVSRLKGTQRVSFASSGVVVDQDSAHDVLMDTTTYGELDAMTIQYNSATQAWGQRAQAENYRQQAKVTRATKQSPWIPAGTSLLSSAGNLGASYAFK